ncbi:MAG: isoaspartyl peptidase/L-asparaginase [Anaerolineae bacterium]
MGRPVMVVHGGAWYIPDCDREAHIHGCRLAAEAGWARLVDGGSALDAVEAAVRVLEDDPTYDAGRGSLLNRVGRVQLDAIVMDGRTLDFGAVAAVGRVRNPITLARRILERCEHSFVVGAGAEALAEAYDLPLCDAAELMGRRDDGAWAPPRLAKATGTAAPQQLGDTVGAIAMDVHGHLAVGTSTGGTPDKWPGRVGDSPLVGCGGYADDGAGAAAATGSGEALMRIVTSKTAVDLMAAGMPAQAAAEAVIARLWERVRGYGGVILVDREGTVGLAHNTPNLAYAYITRGELVVAGVEVSPADTPGRAEGLAVLR